MIVCKNSISFLKISTNSTIPLLPTLNAPFNDSTRGSSSGYKSSFDISSEPIRIETSCVFGSIGGTEEIPRRARCENEDSITGYFSYSPPNSSNNLCFTTGFISPSILMPKISSNSGLSALGNKCKGSPLIGSPSR